MIDGRKWGEYDYIKIPTSQCIDCMQYNTQTTLPKTELTFIGEPIFEKEMEKTSSVSISSNGISIGGIVKDNKLFDDFLVYPDGVDKGININCLIPNKEMIGGKNMNELLNLYKKNKANKIVKEYDKKADEILGRDEIVKVAKEYNTKIEMLISDKSKTEHLKIDIERAKTSLTEISLKENYNEMNKKILELDNFIDTVNAHLDMTDTFEQKQQILKSYGIINDAGTLKSEDTNLVKEEIINVKVAEEKPIEKPIEEPIKKSKRSK